MFYTKYRPQKFSEISQPNDIAVALMQQLSTNKTVHAYLFVGSRGTGKTTTARILAKALNCKKLSKKGDPCDTCDNCMQIKANNFPDLIEIDAASNRGIDDIRNLKEKVNLSASQGGKKVYIIDEVHMLTKEAFNALLKTLEEPPEHVVFILCTTELHKVPDTVKSRCQLFKFKRATKAQLVEKLEYICKEENTKLKKADLEKIAEASLGGFRDAETMLQQVVEGNITVDSLVGLGRGEHTVTFVDALLQKDTVTCLHTLAKLVEDGINLSVWSQDLLSYFRELLFIKAGAHEGIIDTSSEVFAQMQTQAEMFSNSAIVSVLEAFMIAANQLDDTTLPALPLEIAVFKLCNPVDSEERKSISAQPDAGDDNLHLAEIDFSDEFDADEDGAEITLDADELQESAIELDKVLSSWEKIVKETIVLNNSLYALLRGANPYEIKGNKLILEVSYKFHKERLESKKSREIISNVIRGVLGVDIIISCIVNKKVSNNENLTDYNITVPVINSDNLNELFDGALPL